MHVCRSSAVLLLLLLPYPYAVYAYNRDVI